MRHILENPVARAMGMVLATAIIASWNIGLARSQNSNQTLNVPKLSSVAAQGKTIFNRNCAACHGAGLSN